MFFEPSTRTHDGFHNAIVFLGGSVQTTPRPDKFSSVAKGETLHATMHSLWASGFSCVIVRHDGAGDEEFPLRAMADVASNCGYDIAVINAGDGNKEHPTQMLLDLYTIWRLKREALENGRLTIALVGDVQNSRTIHSLALALAGYPGVRVVLIKPDDEHLPSDIAEHIAHNGNLIIDAFPSVQNCPAGVVAVWYFTRYQAERRDPNRARISGAAKHYGRIFGLNEPLLKEMRKDAIIMHPLPHGPEFPDGLAENDPRCVHIQQMRNGLLTRMALLAQILNPAVSFVDIVAKQS